MKNSETPRSNYLSAIVPGIETLEQAADFILLCLDSTLDPEHDNHEAGKANFFTLIDREGPNAIIELCHILSYEKTRSITELAMRRTAQKRLEGVVDQKPVEFAIGCRLTGAEGEWHDALVLAKAADQDVYVSVMFHNGMDFKTYHDTIEEVVTVWEDRVSTGWRPMTIADLQLTAGFAVDVNTKTFVKHLRNRVVALKA